MSSRLSVLLLAVVLAVPLAGACDRTKATPTPPGSGADGGAASSSASSPASAASSGSADPLGAIAWDTTPVDWSRPIATTPPGGIVESGYVGSEACKDCHKDVYTSYMRHSMARTGPRPLASLDAKWLARIFDAGATQPVVHERSGYSYRAFRKGKEYFIEERVRADDGSQVHSWVQPVTMSYSAGTYGMAFYFRQGERLYQAPIDYYPTAKQWGIDPAAAGANPRFSKTLGSFCISCHTDSPRRKAGVDDVFLDPIPTGVGCERCHGPGQKHAASLKAADIVNPANLSPLRQLDTCAQCHESSSSSLRADRGEMSYRPGEPLGSYRINYIAEPAEPDRFILLAHPERMVRSACWRGSGGKLVCTSCHDPHKSSVEQPASWWDAKCTACHAGTACTETAEARHAGGDHCVPCHMRSGPPTSPTLVTITDHWIQKRPAPIRPGSSTPERVVAWPDFIGDPLPLSDDRTAMEAVAYAAIGKKDEAERMAASVAPRGPRVPRFYDWLAVHYNGAHQPWSSALASTAVLRIAPDDVGALGGFVRAMLETPKGAGEAVHALDRILALDPDEPWALEEKAEMLFLAGRPDDAKPLFARAAVLGPTSAASHVALALLARREGHEGDAMAELETARRIEPGDLWILDQLHDGYTKAGDTARAGAIEKARRHFAARPGSGPTEATAWLPAGLSPGRERGE